MGVDNEGPPANAATKEVMAGIADNQAQVVLPGEVNSCLNMSRLLGHNDEHRVVPQSAGIGGGCRRAAGVICEVGPEASGGQLNPSIVSKASYSERKVLGYTY